MAFMPDTSASEQKGIQKATEHLAAASDIEAAKIPALGQALAAASVPVVLPALQATALTPPSAAAIGAAVAAGGITFAPTFTRVKVITVADTPFALIAALASNYTRLHALYGHMNVAGTVIVEDSSATDLTGAMSVAATGKIEIPFCSDPNGCLITAAGKGMSLLTTQIFNGFAIVSQATT